MYKYRWTFPALEIAELNRIDSILYVMNNHSSLLCQFQLLSRLLITVFRSSLANVKTGRKMLRLLQIPVFWIVMIRDYRNCKYIIYVIVRTQRVNTALYDFAVTWSVLWVILEVPIKYLTSLPLQSNFYSPFHFGTNFSLLFWLLSGFGTCSEWFHSL